MLIQAQLGTLLGVRDEVFNYGVSGCTGEKGNLPYWNTKEYRQALACSPVLCLSIWEEMTAN